MGQDIGLYDMQSRRTGVLCYMLFIIPSVDSETEEVCCFVGFPWPYDLSGGIFFF